MELIEVNLDAEKFQEMSDLVQKYENSLREIDNHIRATSEPIPHIIKTLKDTLPEYEELKNL